MSMVELIKSKEKIYNDEKDIYYLFCENKGSDKLIISFPFMTDPGINRYAYVRKLKNIKAHKLFILDKFDSQGCYLIGENKDLSVENSVISLIKYYLKIYNIKFENVIVHGSSKGGWISLYYGIKYGFGYVIAGAPQTRLGYFLVKHRYLPSLKKIADFISGGHENEDMEYLDNLLFNILPNKTSPNIYIHIGIDDYHYQDHIKPFLKVLDKLDIDYCLDIGKNETHNDISLSYPDYLLKILNSIDTKLTDNSMYVTSWDPTLNELDVHVNKKLKVKFNKPIKKSNNFIELKDDNNTVIPIKKSIKHNTLTITPESTLDKNTKYQLIIHSESLLNSNGESIDLSTIYFTTGNKKKYFQAIRSRIKI